MNPFLRQNLLAGFFQFQKNFPLGRGLILCYHSVDDIPTPLSIDTPRFRLQMELLRDQGYCTVTLREVVDYLQGKISLPPKSICLTFDDGYRSVYEKALPILKECGFQATIFLPTDFMGKTSEWLRANRNPEFDSLIPELPLMNWEEIQEMSRAGFLFESHTCSHPDLTKIKDEEIERELAESSQIIEEKTGKKVEFLCYPYGFLNHRLTRKVYSMGFRGACSLDSGWNRPGQDVFSLKRCGIDVGCIDPMLYFYIYTSRLCAPLLALKSQIGALRGGK